jgi:hypothetical protein
LISIEIYDILDASGMEAVGFREFCAVILLVASLESNQLLECLYKHGTLLFDILGGG